MSRICGVVLVAGLGAGCGPASPIDVETIPRSPDERPVLDFAHRLDLARVEVDRSVYRFDRATAPDHLGQGWSDPENPRGVPFAWAMSEQADVKLHVLDRTAGWLHFRAQPFGIGNATQAAHIQLNGVDVGNVPLEGGGAQSYTLRLPPGALRTGENVVSFEFSYAVSPSSLNAAALDQRPLAAMFEHIEISTLAEPAVEPTRPASAVQAPPTLDEALDLSGTSQAIFDLTVPVDGRLEFGHRGTTSRSSAQRTEVALRAERRHRARLL